MSDEPHPEHPIELPGDEPHPEHPIAGTDVRPEHPIYYPPSIWPSPGVPTHPIYYPPSIWPSPGVPTHPIYWPPSIWPSPGFPAHPIVIPPETPPSEVDGEGGYWVGSSRAPLAWVKADTAENAAYNYGQAFGLPVGSAIKVATEVEGFAVGVDAVEAEPR